MQNNTKIWTFPIAMLLLASTTGCDPFGPRQVRVASPDQVHQHGDEELAFSAVVDHTFQEGVAENANTFRLLIDVNTTNVIDETFQKWEGERQFDGAYKDLVVAAICTQHPVQGSLVPDIYCRMSVSGRRSVTLSFTQSSIPQYLVTKRPETTPPKGVASPPSEKP